MAFGATNSPGFSGGGTCSAIPAWTPGITYTEGCYVTYAQNLYLCLANHTSGSTFSDDVANWKLMSGGNTSTGIGAWATSTAYHAGDYVTYQNNLYLCLTDHTSSTFAADASYWKQIGGEGSGISGWETNTAYTAGQYVTYNTNLYICLVSHTSNVFATDLAADKWKLIGYSDDKIGVWATSTDYTAGEYITYDQNLFLCTTSHTSTTFEADSSNWRLIGFAGYGIMDWTTNTEYVAGRYVTYNNDLYICLNDHTSTSSFDSDKTNWKMVGGDSTIYEWAANTTYATDSIIHHKGQLYKVATSITTSNTFDNVPVLEGFAPANWKAGSQFETGAIIQHGDTYYEVTQDFVASDTFSTACMEPITISPWAANTTYSVGDIVIYNNVYYQAKTSFTSGSSFSADNWRVYMYTPVSFANNTIYAKNQLINHDSTIYLVTQGFTSGASFSLICLATYTPTAWQPDTDYNIGDIVENDGDIYVTVQDFHSGAWFASAILESYVPSELTAQQRQNCIEVYNGAMVQAGRVYSTESSLFGTWIDGSNIYEKTFSASTPADASDTTVVSLTGLDISKVVGIDGYVEDADAFYPLNFSNIIKTWADVANDAIKMSVTAHNNVPAVITIRYIR